MLAPNGGHWGNDDSLAADDDVDSDGEGEGDGDGGGSGFGDVDWYQEFFITTAYRWLSEAVYRISQLLSLYMCLRHIPRSAFSLGSYPYLQSANSTGWVCKGTTLKVLHSLILTFALAHCLSVFNLKPFVCGAAQE